MQIEPEIAGWWETTGAAPFVGIYIYFTLHWVVLQGGQGLILFVQGFLEPKLHRL